MPRGAMLRGMDKISAVPQTLQDAIVYFGDPDRCLAFLVAQRWGSKAECPQCGNDEVTFLANQRRWKCRTKHPRQQFSIKVGTIFEDSPIGLDKWLPALWMLVNDKNGMSSYEVARALGVTQKTAWFMLHRLRLALHRGSTTSSAAKWKWPRPRRAEPPPSAHRSPHSHRHAGRGSASQHPARLWRVHRKANVTPET